MIAALIPAAGASRRMGRNKLLLPIPGGTVIQRVVTAISVGRLGRVLVLLAPGAEEVVEHLGSVCPDAETVLLGAVTADMRSTLEHGVSLLEPANDIEAVLIMPADIPLISQSTVEQVVRCFSDGDADVVVPTCNGRRGHPILLRWNLIRRIREIPAGSGVNYLLREWGARRKEVETGDGGILRDMDTAEDYQEILKEQGT